MVNPSLSSSRRESHPKHLAWITEKSYKIHKNDYDTKLSLKMGRALYDLSQDECSERRKEISTLAKEVFLNLYKEKKNRIPHITHRTWLTSTKAPCEAPRKRLKAYIQSLKILRGADWEHNFWCINPSDIPKTIKTLKDSGFLIRIRKAEEVFSEMKAKHVYDAYCKDDQYCFASDILRQNIVNLYGGVYSDLGTWFRYDLTPFLDAYDFIFTDRTTYIDQCFFAYKKNSFIINKYLGILDTLYKLPSKTQGLTRTPRERQGWHTPPLLMLCIDKFSKLEDRFLFVPEGVDSLMWIDHGGSWLGRERYGNKSVQESNLDILILTPHHE